jgi:hypothetical protein
MPTIGTTFRVRCDWPDPSYPRVFTRDDTGELTATVVRVEGALAFARVDDAPDGPATIALPVTDLIPADDD